MTAPPDLATLIAACRANPAPLMDWEARFLADLAARGRQPTPHQRATLDRIAVRAPLDFPGVAARLADRIGDLTRELTGAEPTQRHRDEWRFGRKGGLSIKVAGPHRGWFRDHEVGTGGDALALVAHLRWVPVQDAAEWALGWLGEAGPRVTLHRRYPTLWRALRRRARHPARGTLPCGFGTRRWHPTHPVRWCRSISRRAA